MPSIFNSLSTGYTGLNAAQVGIDTTGHNIANAEVEGYSRQRVMTSSTTPISTSKGNVGNGTEVTDVKRVFDNFVYTRYTDIAADKEYVDYEQTKLEELSSYFPEIDGVGVKSDLAEYYNSWQDFSDNPTNPAIKVALAEQTDQLATHIQQTQEQVTNLQMQINDDLAVSINEVNSIAKEISEINVSINVAESAGSYEANDLRDKRNLLEKDLARLIGAKVNKDGMSSNIEVDSASNSVNGSYSISVAGFNIVDGASYHPIRADKNTNSNGFYELSYERQDGKLIPIDDKIRDGKIGAMLDLRGGSVDSTSGMPTDGTIQTTVSELDAFAKGLIESTNNLYAATPTTLMQSNPVDFNQNDALLNTNLNLNKGSFNLIVYDNEGNVAAQREINLENTTVMTGEPGSDSIEGQIKAQKDDNKDANATNDIDDYFKDGFNFTRAENGELRLELSIDPLSESKGYTFAIEDNLTDDSFNSGTNFAGALGLNRYFDGDSADSIALHSKYQENPTLIQAGKTPVAGDNSLALDMVQHQFERYDYEIGTQSYNVTSYGMFDVTATDVGTATNSAIRRSDTILAQYNTIENEYFSTSKVNVDEEMTNLIKYQTSYSAAAKVITTLDQMMQTLLGIKQ